MTDAIARTIEQARATAPEERDHLQRAIVALADERDALAPVVVAAEQQAFACSCICAECMALHDAVLKCDKSEAGHAFLKRHEGRR